MGRYIVTGGCGFIGSHLVDKLLSQGNEVFVIDNYSTGKKNNLNPKASLYVGDIKDVDLVKQAFSVQPDGCFHLAAIASIEKSNKEWMATHTVNSAGTVHIFEASAKAKIPVIYASSAAIYGPNNSLPISEKEPANPVTAYGIDKYSNELHGQVAHHIHGIPTIGFRFFNVYGPRQDPSSPYSGVISIFIKQVLEGIPFTINGTGQQIRDFVYVSDVVRALMAGMDQKIHTRKGSEIYNVCTGIPTTLVELAQNLEELTGKTFGHVFKPARVGDIERSLGDPSKLYEQLEIKPETTLKLGLKETLESILVTKGALSNVS